MNVIRNENTHHTYFDLLIGIAKCEELSNWVIALYGDVAALIEQWQDGLHVLRRLVKVYCQSLTAVNLCDIGVEVLELVDQKRRRARGEPIVVEITVGHSREQAEWIINTRPLACEMISVIGPLQLCQDFFGSHVVFFAQRLYAFLEVVDEFLLRDATNCGILRQHGYVVQIVELRENAELRELSDTGDEDKSEIRVEIL